MSKRILVQMAVLWQQRELLKEVRKLQLEDLQENAVYSKQHDKEDVLIHTVLRGDGCYWIEENRVIDRMLKNRGKSINDFGTVVQLRQVIDASVGVDNFLHKRNNRYFVESGGKPDLANTSKRELSINPDVGSELLNNWYFFWKYIAGAFPPLTTIFVAIVTTILTSSAIWLYMIDTVDSKLETVPQEQSK